LRTKVRDGASEIAQLRQQGALKLVFPTLFRDDLEAVLVNTSGGVTGGDVLNVAVTAARGSSLTVTTQAAERIYRALEGEQGQITNVLNVEHGARLNWLPQETILFENCGCKRTLSVDLAPDATFLMAETLVFGRLAMGEVLHRVDFTDRVAIRRNGKPIYLDGMNLKGDVASKMARPALGAGSNAVCGLVMVHPQVGQKVAQVRALLPDTAGASMIADDVMVMRLMAVDSYELRQILVPVLALLNNTPLPKSWRL
jgi:urease accessory protein